MPHFFTFTTPVSALASVPAGGIGQVWGDVWGECEWDQRGALASRGQPGRDRPAEAGFSVPGARRAGQATGRSRATRLSALITPRSDACTIDSLMPTPHSTRSPTWISR